VGRRGHGNAVVVGVDATPGALDATAWAAREARMRRQPLRIVHAIDGPEDPDHAPEVYRILDRAVRAARTAAPGISVRVEVETAEPLELLERECAIASVVAVGPPGPGGLTRRIVESAGGLAAGTLAPLVVVPEVPPPDRDAAIAVLVDTSSSGVMAIVAAVAAAARRRVGVRAVRLPDPGESARESAATLEALVRRARSAYPEVDIDTQLAAGRPVRVLADLSAQVDLVVVGAREFGPDSALALGAVRQSLLGLARCPVMIVPARLAPTRPHVSRPAATEWPHTADSSPSHATSRHPAGHPVGGAVGTGHLIGLRSEPV
jgi:nucleotide-binding universal stress UspA family protein